MGSIVFENIAYFDGTSLSLKTGCIRISNGHIESIAAQLGRRPDDVWVPSNGLYATPGFIDSHCHLIYNDIRGFYDMDLARSIPEASLDAVVSARKLLSCGFTTIRDVGSRANIGVTVRNAIASGDIPGPRVLAAGSIISTVGGLLDGHPSHIFRGKAPADGNGVFVNGPWEARSAVRQQAKDGVDWVKTELSGTGFNPFCGPHDNTLTEEEMAALVDEAHRRRIKVAVHVESEEGAAIAVRTGVDTIEHGVHMTPGTIAEMIDRGIALSPTLALFATVPDWGEEAGLTPEFVESQRRIRETHIEMVRTAYKLGAHIIAGSDAGLPKFPQGSALKDAVAYVDLVGMSAADALKTLTSTPASVLGIDDRAGRIEAGLEADLVLFSGDPIADISVVNDGSRRVAVLKGGAVVAGALPSSEVQAST